MDKDDTFPPWGSKGAVNRAGAALRAGPISGDDAIALELWRGSHSRVLNTFQAILRNRTKGKGIVVAQRLKRRATILDKLHREPKMELARMDDVAGCRLIFGDVKSLKDFRGTFLQANFAHRRKNDFDKYDYIKRPKSSGYRGIHDVYEYNVSSKEGARFKGLMLELQYRTKSQHAWATAVEVVSQMTDYQPKFNRGGEAGIIFFQFASEIIARTQEGLTSCFPEMTDKQLVSGFQKADSEASMMRFLYSLNVLQDYSEGGHLVLQYENNGGLQIHSFDKISAATKALFQMEKDFPADNIVLVQADTFEQIRSAYRNYFSDATEFLVAIESGCLSLSEALSLLQQHAQEARSILQTLLKSIEDGSNTDLSMAFEAALANAVASHDVYGEAEAFYDVEPERVEMELDEFRFAGDESAYEFSLTQSNDRLIVAEVEVVASVRAETTFLVNDVARLQAISIDRP